MLLNVEMVLTFGKRNGATIQAGGEGCVNFGNAAIFTHSLGVITIPLFQGIVDVRNEKLLWHIFSKAQLTSN